MTKSALYFLLFCSWIVHISISLIYPFSIRPPKVALRQQVDDSDRATFSSAEISNQAKQQDTFDFQFDDALVDDMTNCCQTLEKRVREGPKSLSEKDVLEVESALKQIIQEMNAVTENLNRLDSMTPLNQNEGDKSMSFQKTEEVLTRLPPKQPSSKKIEEAVVIDTANDDGGNMGQPRGTVNTYYLEGMEEMNAEEFRSALERSLIERQAERRKMGVVGNNAVKDYLNNL